MLSFMIGSVRDLHPPCRRCPPSCRTSTVALKSWRAETGRASFAECGEPLSNVRRMHMDSERLLFQSQRRDKRLLEPVVDKPLHVRQTAWTLLRDPLCELTDARIEDVVIDDVVDETERYEVSGRKEVTSEREVFRHCGTHHASEPGGPAAAGQETIVGMGIS